MTSRKSRASLGLVLGATMLIAAGAVVAVRTGPSSGPAGRLVVRGRVTGTGGEPVSGIKVWLNAWPTAAVVRDLTASDQPVRVTVVGWVITSATGSYALRVAPSAALAADAANGVVKFMVMTGDGAGWDALSFSRRLPGYTARTTPAAPPGSTQTADLRLKPYQTPRNPARRSQRAGVMDEGRLAPA